MPYNYLIDPKIRENFKIEYENSVIIMDEAHNIEKVAEEVAGFEIHISLLNCVVAELKTMINNVECSGKQHHSSVKNLNEILTMTRNFQAYIRDFDILNSKRMPIAEIKDEDGVYPGSQVFNLFFDGSRYTKYEDYSGPKDFEGITAKNFGHWHYIFEKCLADIADKSAQKEGAERSYLERWWDAVKKVIRLHKQLDMEE